MSSPDPQSNSLGDQAVSAVLWTATQKWLARIGGFVTIAILTRLLTPEDFGVVAAATAILPVTYLLADLGFSTYVVQAKEVDRRMLSTAFWFSLAVSIVLAAGLVAAAPVLAAIFGSPESADVLRVLALLVVLTAMSAVSTALLRRSMRFRALALQSFVASLVGQIVAIVLALTGFGVWALVAQMLIVQFIMSVCAVVLAGWVPGLRLSKSELSAMASFGSRVIGADLVGVLRQWAEYAIIANLLGTAALGYLNIAQRLVQIAQDVTAAAIMPVSTVVFAKIRTESERLTSGYFRSLGLTYATIIPVMVFLAVTGPDLVPFLFGDGWGESILPSQILAVTSILVMVAVLDHGLFYGTGRPGSWLAFSITVDVTTVVVALFTAPHGLVAWSIGFLSIAVVSTIVRWPLVARLIDTSVARLAGISGRAAACAALAAGAGILVFILAASWPPVLTLIAAGLAVVAGHLVGMRLFMRSHLAAVIQLVRRRLRPSGTLNDGNT